MKLTYNLFFRPQTKVGKCKYSNIRDSVYIFLVYTWNENRKLSFDSLGIVFMTFSVRTISKGPCIKLYDLRSFFPLSDCLTSYFLIYGWSSENCRRRKVFWRNNFKSMAVFWRSTGASYRWESQVEFPCVTFMTLSYIPHLWFRIASSGSTAS